ncbi:MAG: hypothetical protein ACR2K2_14810 [Mycobacteriales bacterium]
MALHRQREPEGLEILRDRSLERHGSVAEHTAAVTAYARDSRTTVEAVRALIAGPVPAEWAAAGTQEIEDARTSRVYALGDCEGRFDGAIARHRAIRARIEAAR